MQDDWLCRAVEAKFNEAERSAALAVIACVPENEQARVQLAAIALSGGNLDELRRIVQRRRWITAMSCTGPNIPRSRAA